MNQLNNNPSELETKLSSNALDAVAKAFNLGMSPQELQEFKEQTVKDAKAISQRSALRCANEWELDRSESDDNK